MPVCHNVAGMNFNGKRDGARAERSYRMTKGCNKSLFCYRSLIVGTRVGLVTKFPEMEDVYRLEDCVLVSGQAG